MKNVDAFMPGCHYLYRIRLRNILRSILHRVGLHLEYQSIIVGRLRDGNESTPLFFEPKLQIDQSRIKFFETPERAFKSIEIDDDRSSSLLSQSAARPHRNSSQSPNGQMFRNLVKEMMRRTFPDQVPYVSIPAAFGEHEILSVFLFDRKDLAKLGIASSSFADGEGPVSLFDAVMLRVGTLFPQFFEATSVVGLSSDQFGRKSAETEIVRQAGEFFLSRVATKVDGVKPASSFFENCNRISSLKYEGSEAVGRIIVTSVDNPSVDQAIVFKHLAPIHDLRRVRKYLEMAKGDLALLATPNHIFGLGYYSSSREDKNAGKLFQITFEKSHRWTVWQNQRILLAVVDGEPTYPKPPLRREDVIFYLARTFKANSPASNQKLADLIDSACRANHGAMIVISSSAKSEAKRLQAQCTEIKPVPLGENIVSYLSNIDGGLLIDPSGTCYAIGVILDGLATGKGDPARGARYNSAIRYAESRSDCLIAVISEDGMVNIVPAVDQSLLDRKTTASFQQS